MIERIFTLAELDASQRRRVEEVVAADVVSAARDSPRRAQAALAQCDVCFGNVPADWLSAAPRLRWLQLTTTGTEAYRHVTWPPDLLVTNIRGLNRVPVAETVVASLLAAHRNIVGLADLQRAQQWQRQEVRRSATLLSGSRVAVLGAGTIAGELKSQLLGFRCTVRLYGRAAGAADVAGVEHLDDLLAWADIVIACLPETSDTVGLLNRRRLELLQPGAMLVNVGRGSVLDEEALADLLDDGHLRACVLDVTNEEPLPAGHRLWTTPRCLLTQHTAGGWEAEGDAKFDHFLANLRRFVGGERLENLCRVADGG